MAKNSHNWDPTRYSREARFVSDLGNPVVDLLAPRAGERILDLGCGDGALTRVIADAGCEVLGVDASPEMVAAARAQGVEARVVDGEDLPFEGDFDAVFSNAALHWMPRPERVLSGVRRSLRPGGRFVGEFGGHGNVAAIVDALVAALDERGIDAGAFNPWFFPDAEEYRLLLERHGFEVETIELFSRPTPLPGDVIGWLGTFAGSFVAALPEEARQEFLADVAERCRPLLCDDSGQWVADYVRLRFAASRKEQAIPDRSPPRITRSPT